MIHGNEGRAAANSVEDARSPLSILVADDDRTNRLVLNALLSSEGFRPLLAVNGAQAVTLYERERPDVVLMDVMMPVMDGYEATRRIKALTGDGFVAVVFLTALNDEQSLARCIEVGGDDFMTKPFNRIVLVSKIMSYARLNRLYATLQAQNRELSKYHALLSREHEMAEQIFTAITGAGRLDAANIRYLLSPMATTSGDLILAAQTPSGGQHLMLGDFAGHGLSAALGAIPVSDIFYSMTAKGFHICDIVREINAKLYSKLPTGFFLAACLVEVDAKQRTARIWNGGIPDAIMIRDGRGIFRRLASHSLPLGIVDSEELGGEMTGVELRRGDRLYLYSDGLIESTDRAGHPFGQERLEACFHEDIPVCDRFDEICRRLHEFRSDQPQSDDITLVEITFDPALLQAGAVTGTAGRHAADWQCRLEVAAERLGDFVDLQGLVDLLVRANGITAHKSRIYTIVTELFNNAVDHGVLGLDREMKHSDSGFYAYYEAREAALRAAPQGWVRLCLSCRAQHDGQRVTVTVEDSGPGFDVSAVRPRLDDNNGFSGRGLALVRSLCGDVQFHRGGSTAEAVYHCAGSGAAAP
jgi:CheY-like chemotaxis protein/anti-sigma regulatory factor (Ser/Thr protein kinase)